jgi:gas vesicle protein
MSHRNRKRTLKRIAIGGTVAAVAGYVAGILTAPKSGKQTRADIKDKTEKSYADAEKELKKLHGDLDKVIKDASATRAKFSRKAQKELAELVIKAKDTKEKVREMISAVREGEAADKDLKRAVKDANAALQHLRDYLKK